MTQADKKSVTDRLSNIGMVTPTLADLLKDVPNLGTPSGTGRDQIEYIDIDQIESDPGNFYKLTQLDELAANIEVVGLQQPLRVRTSEKDPQRVVLVSGHRRRAALDKLVKEGREDLRAVPCIREHSSGSAALQELRLIYANRDTRVISSAELAKQAERVEILLYQLKEEGFKFPGRMRDHVAQACKISAPKLSRLKVIREKLIPGYMALFEKDKLPEQTAYALARLPADFQSRMFSALSAAAPRGDAAEKVLKKYNEGWRWNPQLTCPDGKACKRGDVFLRRDCEAPGWAGFCGGNTCCLKCNQAKTRYSPCERRCSKAKAQRKEALDKEKEAELQRHQKQGRKYQKETQPYAKRLLRAIEAAGLPDDTVLNWRYYDWTKVASVRAWANGEFDDPGEWLSARLVPGECSEPLRLAKLLNCSTDFLMGLTEELRPALAQEDTEVSLEELAEREDSWNDLKETLSPMTTPEESTRHIRWENRGRPLPENRLILTYRLGDMGPVFRPVIWNGTQFRAQDGGGPMVEEDYTHWLEIPGPGSGEALQLDQAEGQLVICGWMPGGTFPAEDCEVVADFNLGDGNIVRETCIYFDGHFNFRVRSGQVGARINMEVVRWMRLPPVE